MNDAGNIEILRSLRRWGFLFIAIPAVIVALAVGLVVRNIVLDGYGGLVAAGLDQIVSESYRGDPLDGDQQTEAYQHLDAMVHRRIANGRLAHAWVYDEEGNVIYSTVANDVGTAVEVDPQAQAALGGEVGARAVSAESIGIESDSARLLEIVAPLHMGQKDNVVGWIRGYRPYSAVSASVRDSVLAVVGVVLLGALISYAALWWLVQSALRAIERGKAEEMVLETRLAGSLKDLERHSLGTLQALATAVDAKDSYTARHAVSVADIATAIAFRMGMEDQIEIVERAGLLHDIGKIGVPESVLKKQDLLTAEEYRQIQEHSQVGADIVETVPFLSEILPGVLFHHERWDGRGYPSGLAGEDIPLIARVLGVADSFDAMTSDRPYREGMPLDIAVREIQEHSGTQFDPEIAQVLIDLIREGHIRRGALGSTRLTA